MRRAGMKPKMSISRSAALAFINCATNTTKFAATSARFTTGTPRAGSVWRIGIMDQRAVRRAQCAEDATESALCALPSALSRQRLPDLAHDFVQLSLRQLWINPNGVGVRAQRAERR